MSVFYWCNLSWRSLFFLYSLRTGDRRLWVGDTVVCCNGNLRWCDRDDVVVGRADDLSFQCYVYMFNVYSVWNHDLVGDKHLLQIKATVLLFFTVMTLNKILLLSLSLSLSLSHSLSFSLSRSHARSLPLSHSHSCSHSHSHSHSCSHSHPHSHSYRQSTGIP